MSNTDTSGVPISSIFATADVEDEAEAALVAVLEDRRELLRSTGQSDSQRDVLSAVPPHAANLLIGEKSPRGHRRLASASDASTGSDPAARKHLLLSAKENMSSRNIGIGSSVPGEDGKVSARVRFTTLVSRVRKIANEGGTAETDTGASKQISSNILATEESVASPFIGANVVPNVTAKATDTDKLFKNAQVVENLFQIAESPEEEEEEEQEEGGRTGVGEEGVEVTKSSSDGSLALSDDEEACPPGEVTPLVTTSKTSSTKTGGIWARICSCWSTSPMRRKEISVAEVLAPNVVLGHAFRFLRTTFIFVMVPLLVGAALLFYFCGNPEFQFLPRHASLSWWLIFSVRQLVTLQLAHCTEYLVVDALACRSSAAVKIFGPLLTLFAMQAKGWPFTLASWGVWDLILLHGDTAFCLNWLFMFDIAMFSDQNPDSGFLSSDIYFRVLLAAIITGAAVSIKKTYLALYMGRRTFEHYKPRLEPIMVNIVLLAEIADLAAETETPEFQQALAEAEVQTYRQETRGGKWKDIQFQQSKAQELEDESGSESVGTDEVEEAKELKITKWSEISTVKSHTSDDGPPNAPPDDVGSPQRTLPPRGISAGSDKLGTPPPDTGKSFYRRMTSSTIKIKNLLDRWEEPENKLDKAKTPSIYDILQFRKALAYLDETAPFSESFGPSATRDQCIRSSQKVYKRLLNFVPDATILPFDVIGSIAMDENENYDKEISLALVRLFRPDRDDELSLLAFVQSCDWVYKKVRYFRASVANSTMIDRVLEHDFNIIFYFALIIVIMTILDIDAWTLLVSFSTLIVSFSFAVGSSAARAIEGVLLIAMRRPYDLGDRISLTSAEFVGQPDTSLSWFVEDVNLFTTTLRFAPTNEVSTVNNGSIANSRIVNFARSQKALVNLTLLFKLEATNDQIDLFRSALDRYIKDNPRCWVAVVMFRINNIDPDMEVIEYKVRIQHVKAWQEMAGVLVNQGELLKFCNELATKLGIVYDSPPRSMSVQLTSPKGETGGLAGVLERYQSSRMQSEESLNSDELLKKQLGGKAIR